MGFVLGARAEAGIFLQGYSDKNPGVMDGSTKVDLTWDGTNNRYKNDDAVYDYVLFGRYPQAQAADDIYQPIMWRVLSADRTGNAKKALLLSDMNLDVQKFDSGTQQKWALSSLRKWMNSLESVSGFNQAPYFTTLEQGAVYQIKHTSPFENGSDNSGLPNNTDLSPTETEDKFFALSYQELLNPAYGFNAMAGVDENRKGLNTVYSGNVGVPGIWWSRSPVSFGFFYAWIVNDAGYLNDYDVYGTGVAVRPASFLNLESVIFKSGSDPARLADEGGGNLNPYVLYFTSEARHPAAILSVNGNQLTVDLGVSVVHAFKDTPNITALTNKFTVMNGGVQIGVTGVAVTNGKLVLTLDKAFAYGEDVSELEISYTDPDPTSSSDGLAIPEERIVIKSLSALDYEVPPVNLTPQPPSGGPDDNGNGGGQSGANSPLAVIGVISDERYPVSEHKGQRQTDGTYLITLPVGTDPSVLESLYLKITLPAGATISPGLSEPFDFTDPEGKPVTFVITAADGTKRTIVVEARIAQPDVAEGAVVGGDPSQCSVIVTFNGNGAAQAAGGRAARATGTLAVEVRMPFADGFDPATLDGLSAELSGLANLSFACVDADGDAAPLTPRAAGEAYLRIEGTAASESALSAATLARLTFWLANDDTEYRQTFSPALKFSDMPITYTNAPPSTDDDEEEEKTSGSGGCNAGAFAALALLTAGAAVKRRG